MVESKVVDVDKKVEMQHKETVKIIEEEREEKKIVNKKMVEENQQKIQKLEEAVKEDLNVKCNDIIKKSSQGVVNLQERYDGLLEKFSKRMGYHEHQVTEL